MAYRQTYKRVIVLNGPDIGKNYPGRYESLFSHGEIPNTDNSVRTHTCDTVIKLMREQNLQVHDTLAKHILHK